MRSAVVPLLAVVAVSLLLTRSVGQSTQRVPVDPTPQGIHFGPGGVPSGYMILGDSETAPAGYTYTGLTVSTGPMEERWTVASPMLEGRRELAAAVMNGEILAIGGFGAGGHLASVEAYSPSQNSWSPRSPMPTPRSQLSAVAVGQKIYAIGGFNGAFLGTVEEYDPSADLWISKTPMPTPRRLHSMVVLNGKILVIGGHNGAALTTVEEYDPATDSWTTKGSLPAPNSEGAAVLLNGIVYMTGGDNGFQPNHSTMAYNPSAATWSTLPGPSIYDHGAVVIGGAVYIFGGNTGGGTTSATIQFGPDLATWSDQLPMPTPRQELAAVAFAGRAYALGGRGGTAAPTAVEVFEPAARPLYVHRRN